LYQSRSARSSSAPGSASSVLGPDVVPAMELGVPVAEGLGDASHVFGTVICGTC